MQLKIGYLFQCPPRAPPWVNIQPTKRPVRAKASYQKAFALTGRLRYIPIIPRTVPWARSFCPFRACGQKNLLLPFQGVLLRFVFLSFLFLRNHHRSSDADEQDEDDEYQRTYCINLEEIVDEHLHTDEHQQHAHAHLQVAELIGYRCQ